MQRVSIVSTVLLVGSLYIAGPLHTEPAQGPNDKQRVSHTGIGSSILIVGILGCPVGAVVKIRGYKKANGPLANWFWVESIDGKRLHPKRGIPVNGIAAWKDGTKATLIGHETGILEFVSLEDTNYGIDDPRWNGPYQRLDLTFEVDRIEEPSGLVLDRQ